MFRLGLEQLAAVLGGTVEPAGSGDGFDGSVTARRIGVDSRRPTPDGVFFALAGDRADGHRFLAGARANGYVAAVVAADADLPDDPGLAIIRVDSPLAALRRLAAWWRGRAAGAVWLGLAGGRGKTLVKDALAAALAGAARLAVSPGSFNSQLGVALSVLAVPPDAEAAIVETAADEPGGMAALAGMVRPGCGIFTGGGEIHQAAFPDRAAWLEEHLRLFHDLPADGWLLAPRSLPDDDLAVLRRHCPAPVHRAGDPGSEDRWPSCSIEPLAGPEGHCRMRLAFPGRPGAERVVTVAAPSPAYWPPLEVAWLAAGLLDRSLFPLQSLERYEPAATRLAIWPSPWGVTLAADACGDDELSVRHAAGTLTRLRRPEGRAFLVLGLDGRAAAAGRPETTDDAAPFAGALAPLGDAQAIALARGEGIDELVLVAPPRDGSGRADEAVRSTRDAHATRGKRLAAPAVVRTATAAAAAEYLRPRLRGGDTVLFRGGRAAGLAEAATLLLDPPAASRLAVDLRAIRENLARFRRLMPPGGRVMAMVKAQGYGTGLVQLGRELERLGADALGVSTPDEGAWLRRAGVRLPILAMLCPPEEADKAVRYRLAAALYSEGLAAALAEAAARAGEAAEVHLKIDSGMGRLGVRPEEAAGLARMAARAGLRITGVMTHFAAADDPAADAATRAQIRAFESALASLKDAGFGGLTRHAAATAGAARFPEARYDMARIGIGLYGGAPSRAVAEACRLAPALRLTTRLAEIGERRAGERIGYGGAFVVPEGGLRAGIVPLGYHDGLPWSVAGRGARLWIRGRPAPLLGRVSMDSAALDLSAIPEARVGDEALVWGRGEGAAGEREAVAGEELAGRAGTISYELLARLGPRVQRVFIAD